MKRLHAEIEQLVSHLVLNRDQADRLWSAAQADLSEVDRTGAGERTGGAPARPAESRGGAVLEVLGYVGGALLLGALIFLGFTLWEDLDRLGRNTFAIGSAAVPLGGGAALVVFGVRREVGKLLLALGCFAAGFAYFTVFSDEKVVASAAVVLATSAVGVAVLRAGALLVSGWVGAMGLVISSVIQLLEDTTTSPDEAIATWMAVGFVLVGAVFTAAGVLVSRATAWTLAGLSGWAASLAVMMAPAGEWWSLLLATVTAGLLLLAFVAQHRYPYAVLGCLVLLSMWPAALVQIVESPLGVALGLLAAGAVLIGVVVVLSRRRRSTAAALQRR